MPPFPTPVDPGDLGRGPMIMGLTWTVTILAIVAVVLRFYLRLRFADGLGVDDWLMMVAMAFQTMAYHYGLGKHDTSLTPDQTMQVLKWMWLTTPGLVVSAVARISIAVLLIKLFGVHKWFKWFLIVVSTSFTLLTIAIIPCTYLQVTPVSGNWDPFEPSKRWDKHIYIDLAYLGQALWTFTDLAFVLLPITIIWRLQMSLQRRMAVIFLLSASIITMVLSILKTISLGQVQTQQANPHATDVLYNASLMILYSGLEQAFVIIMGCVPSLRAITRPEVKQSISNSLVCLLRPRRSSKASSTESLGSNEYGAAHGAGGGLGRIDGDKTHRFTTSVTYERKSGIDQHGPGNVYGIQTFTETEVLYSQENIERSGVKPAS